MYLCIFQFMDLGAYCWHQRLGRCTPPLLPVSCRKASMGRGTTRYMWACAPKEEELASTLQRTKAKAVLTIEGKQSKLRIQCAGKCQESPAASTCWPCGNSPEEEKLESRSCESSSLPGTLERNAAHSLVYSSFLETESLEPF